jgi:hypothetical protein
VYVKCNTKNNWNNKNPSYKVPCPSQIAKISALNMLIRELNVTYSRAQLSEAQLLRKADDAVKTP